MRIVIVYRYFWPDTAPYSLLLGQMVPWLVDGGHEVSILSGYPAYANPGAGTSLPKRETVFGAKVTRVSLLTESGRTLVRAVNMVLFSLWAALKILFMPRQDLVWFGTTPPVVQPLLVMLAAKLRRTKTLYHVQDIHPEIVLAAGEMKPGIASKLMLLIDRFVMRHVSILVTLSHDMKEHVLNRIGRKRPVEVINNFAIGEGPPLAASARIPGPVRICYAGNIGRFQNLEKFVEAFADLSDDEVVLEFVGDGKLAKSLQAYCIDHKLQNVVFHGRKSADETFRFLQSCDIGLISLQPGLFRYAFPSKTQTYLASGLRVIAMIEPESQLAHSISANELGVALAWTVDPKKIVASVRLLASQARSERIRMTPPPDLWAPAAMKERWIELLRETETA